MRLVILGAGACFLYLGVGTDSNSLRVIGGVLIGAVIGYTLMGKDAR